MKIKALQAFSGLNPGLLIKLSGFFWIESWLCRIKTYQTFSGLNTGLAD